EKVLATGEYTDDMEVNGMVYASAVRSAYPRAIVKAIRMEKALEADGILAIYTADDIPGSVKTGHLKQDWDAMIPIGKITHYLGDAICLVVGETREAVEAAKKLVEVDRSEEHTSELQSRFDLVCRLLLEKKKKKRIKST